MQTKRESVIEATTNTVIGLLIGLGIQIYVLGSFGFRMQLWQNIFLTLVIAIASFLRSYLLRRFFNWYRRD